MTLNERPRAPVKAGALGLVSRCPRVISLFKKRSLIPSAAKAGDDYQAVVVTALHSIPVDAS
jgi:hypothetical protein